MAGKNKSNLSVYLGEKELFKCGLQLQAHLWNMQSYILTTRGSARPISTLVLFLETDTCLKEKSRRNKTIILFFLIRPTYKLFASPIKGNYQHFLLFQE